MNKKNNPFKRGNSWTFVYYIKDEKGNRVQKWKGGYKTKAEAESALREYKAKTELDIIIPSASETVASYMDKWFNIHSKTLQPNTINSYQRNIDRYIKPSLGKVKLKDLKPVMIQSFYFDLQNEVGLSPRSIKYVHNVLKTALKDAVRNRLISENPCEFVKTPKIHKYKAQLLDASQLQILFEALNNTKYEAEIKLACLHGLRRGEVLGFRESDIDFEKHTMAITQQVTNVRLSTEDPKSKKYYGIKSLKSESSYRTLELSDESERLIKRKMLFNEYQKKKLGDLYEDNGLLCCKEDGSILSPQSLNTGFKAILKKCGLPDMRFHDLRHSYATLCIDLNVPIKVISDALGHSSIAVTANVYADSISAKKELADKVANAIKKPNF